MFAVFGMTNSFAKSQALKNCNSSDALPALIKKILKTKRNIRRPRNRVVTLFKFNEFLIETRRMQMKKAVQELLIEGILKSETRP